MKKHLRTLCTLFFALVSSLCLAVGLTACETHEHTWSDDWSSDATHHWHAPACDDTDELKDKAEHVDEDEDGKCDTCDYEVGHEHTWDDVWHGNAEGHWHNATCSHTDVTSAIEPHVDADEDEACDLCGEYTEHVHTWEEEYQSNAEGHWHNANCSHKDETSEVEPHVDVDEDGFCDDCNFEVGHDHTWADEWEYNDEGHWHKANCTHKDETTAVEPHQLDELGDCEVCDYHEHVMDDKYSVDEYGHWYAALCGHSGAESYALHDFVEGKCVCGVEAIEADIYHDYYLEYAKFLGEESLNFTAWHAQLVEAGVKHVEINAIGDVVYTYAVEGEDDVTETVYLAKRTVAITLTRGTDMSAETSFPVINYNIVATITGDEGTEDVVVGTASTSITGEGTVEFIPYYGITSATVTYKLEVAEINGAFQITEAAKAIAVVATDKEEVAISYAVQVALGVGENNKLASVMFNNASREHVKKTFALKAPEGWYWLTYDWQDGDKPVYTQYLGAQIDNGKWYDLYSSASLNGQKEYRALIYVPEGAKQITLDNYYTNSSTFTDGRSVTLTPYEDTEINEINKTYYVSAGYAVDTSIAAPQTPINLEPGTYILSVVGVGVTTTINAVTISGTAVSLSSGKATVTIGEDDDYITVKLTYTSYYRGNYSIASVNFSTYNTIEQDKAEEITFTADNAGGVYYTFTAPKAGTYYVGLTSLGEGAVLTNVRVGQGATATGLYTGDASAIGISSAIELEEGGTLQFNVNYNSTSNYPTVTVKIFEIAYGTIAKDEAKDITFTADNVYGVYYEFTAPTSQYYSIQLTAAEGYDLTNVRVGKGSALTGYLEVKPKSTTATTELIYLAEGEKISFNVNYNGNADFPKVSVKVIDGTMSEVKAGTEQSVYVTSSEKEFYRSFTADKAGYYVISGNYMYDGSTTSTGAGYLRYIRVGFGKTRDTVTVDNVIAQGTANRWSVAGALYLDANETVILCISYNYTSYYGEFIYEINYVEPTELTADTATTVALDMKNSYKLVTFTATGDGVHALQLALAEGSAATALTGVYLSNIETGAMVVAKSPALPSTTFISLEKGDKLILLLGFEPTSATAAAPTVSMTFNSPVTPTSMTVNTAYKIVSNNTSTYEFYSFTAPEDGIYDIMISSTAGLPYLEVINLNLGTTPFTSSSTLYRTRSTYYTYEKGTTVIFVLVYKNTTANEYTGYFSINFATEKDTIKMEVNKGAQTQLTEELPIKHFTFTAPETGTYRLFLASPTDLRYIYAARDGSTSSFFSVTAANTKFYTTTVALEKDQVIKIKLYYTGNLTISPTYGKISLSFNFASEAATTKLEENKSVDVSLDLDTQVKYYTFTAPADATYKLIATSKTSIAYLRVYRNVGGTSLIYQTAAAAYIAYDITLAKDEVLLLEFYYQPAASTDETVYPYVVNFTVSYKAPVDITLNTPAQIKFGNDNQYASYKFTAPKAQYYVIELDAAGENVLNNVTVNNGSTTYITAAADSTSAKSDLIWVEEGASLSFQVVYSNTANYPEVTVKVVTGTAQAIELDTEDSVVYSASAKMFYRQFTAEKAGTYVITGTYEYSSSTGIAYGLRYTRIGRSGVVDNVVAQGTANRYSLAGTFYLEEGETIILTISYNYTSYYGTFKYKVVLEEPTQLASGTAADVKLVYGKLYSAVSYTATVAGEHTLDLALSTGSAVVVLTNVMVYNGLTGATLIAKSTLSLKTTYSYTFELARNETIILVFVYEASAAITENTLLPTVSAKITGPDAPEGYYLSVENPAEDVEIGGSAAEAAVINLENVEAGDYTITVAAGPLGGNAEITVVIGEKTVVLTNNLDGTHSGKITITDETTISIYANGELTATVSLAVYEEGGEEPPVVDPEGGSVTLELDVAKDVTLDSKGEVTLTYSATTGANHYFVFDGENVANLTFKDQWGDTPGDFSYNAVTGVATWYLDASSTNTLKVIGVAGQKFSVTITLTDPEGDEDEELDALTVDNPVDVTLAIVVKGENTVRATLALDVEVGKYTLTLTNVNPSTEFITLAVIVGNRDEYSIAGWPLTDGASVVIEVKEGENQLVLEGLGSGKEITATLTLEAYEEAEGVVTFENFTVGYSDVPTAIDTTKLAAGTYTVTIAHDMAMDVPNFIFSTDADGEKVLTTITGVFFGTVTEGTITITDGMTLYLGSGTMAQQTVTITFTPVA